MYVVTEPRTHPWRERVLPRSVRAPPTRSPEPRPLRSPTVPARHHRRGRGAGALPIVPLAQRPRAHPQRAVHVARHRHPQRGAGRPRYRWIAPSAAARRPTPARSHSCSPTSHTATSTPRRRCRRRVAKPARGRSRSGCVEGAPEPIATLMRRSKSRRRQRLDAERYPPPAAARARDQVTAPRTEHAVVALFAQRLRVPHAARDVQVRVAVDVDRVRRGRRPVLDRRGSRRRASRRRAAPRDERGDRRSVSSRRA